MPRLSAFRSTIWIILALLSLKMLRLYAPRGSSGTFSRSADKRKSLGSHKQEFFTTPVHITKNQRHQLCSLIYHISNAPPLNSALIGNPPYKHCPNANHNQHPVPTPILFPLPHPSPPQHHNPHHLAPSPLLHPPPRPLPPHHPLLPVHRPHPTRPRG